jgi:hypothetical protein
MLKLLFILILALLGGEELPEIKTEFVRQHYLPHYTV